VTFSRDLAWLFGELAALAHIAIAAAVTVHVLLNKRNIGASISWMGIAWLSPFIGAALYFALGVNRVKRRALTLRRERSHLFAVDEMAPNAPDAGPLAPLEYAIGRLTGLSAEADNAVQLLRNGDEAYPAMLAAIDAAKKSVGLCSYIFRADAAGEPFIAALIRAHKRGVHVRVLIDGIGSGYFWSGTYDRLRRAGVPVDRFLHSYFPWRTPFLNLRNHRIGGVNHQRFDAERIGLSCHFSGHVISPDGAAGNAASQRSVIAATVNSRRAFSCAFWERRRSSSRFSCSRMMASA